MAESLTDVWKWRMCTGVMLGKHVYSKLLNSPTNVPANVHKHVLEIIKTSSQKPQATFVACTVPPLTEQVKPHYSGFAHGPHQLAAGWRLQSEENHEEEKNSREQLPSPFSLRSSFFPLSSSSAHPHPIHLNLCLLLALLSVVNVGIVSVLSEYVCAI